MSHNPELLCVLSVVSCVNVNTVQFVPKSPVSVFVQVGEHVWVTGACRPASQRV